MEQRYQAVLALIQGWRVVEVAHRLGVSRQTVHNWIARYQAGGLGTGVSIPPTKRIVFEPINRGWLV